MRLEQRGVTFIELIFAVAILAITLGIAIPSFAELLRSNRVTAAVSELHVTLFYARSEAIKRRARVSVCTSSDLDVCHADIGWHRGWIVFEDGNGDGIRDPGEQILQTGTALGGGVVASGNGPLRDYVSYISSGSTRRASGALQMGTITVCGGGRGRQIVISANGRPRVQEALAC